eukprot:TRINITY_DN5103_c0_g2_i5.p1 TRINITY_DN5103_c0_g2~~TRINITY_DN5103_c0_g2_i5.p1  ORF type:complete len:720 (+),score=185.09 TRINITY_DN5103_c0_g2_i5:277-2436(+)
MFVIGLGWGYCTRKYHGGAALDDSLDHVITIDPHLVLTIFIPALLMESGLALNVHVFKKVMMQCLWLAGPGVLISIALSTLMAKYVFPDGWNWNESLLFGAIVSATDPVAVGALLKELGAPESLATIIEGESLFNDGTAFVLFLLFLKNAEHAQSWHEMGTTLIRSSLGGAAFGVVMGLATVLVLRYNHRRSDSFVELMLTLFMPYLTFWVAENPLELSGVLAVVCMAVTINRHGNFFIRYHHALHAFWHQLAWIANTLVFVISGGLVGEMFYNRVDVLHPGYQIVNYLGINLIRAVVVFGSFPLLRRLGYKNFDASQATVATWGGLRGAIALAMGIIVYEDTNLNEEHRIEIFDYVSMLVMLTLVINGTTTGFVLRWLQYDCKSKSRISLANQAREGFVEHGRRFIEGWSAKASSDSTAGLTQWDIVKDNLNLLDSKTEAAFAEFRTLEESEHTATHQVKEQLILLCKFQLSSLSQKDMILSDALLILQDSCDRMITSKHTQLQQWWVDKLQPQAEKIKNRWSCKSACQLYGMDIELLLNMQAVEMCLGFVTALETVIKNQSDAIELRGSSSKDPEVSPVAGIESQFLHQLKMAVDDARVWLTQQPVAVVATAETRKSIKHMLFSMEHKVQEETELGSLGEAEAEAVLKELRDLRVWNHEHKRLLEMYNALETKQMSGGLMPRSDESVQQASVASTPAPGLKEDVDAPLLDSMDLQEP